MSDARFPQFVTEAGAYRDAEEGLRGRREDLIAARRRELRALVPRARRAYTRRIARQVFGAILLASGVTVFAGTTLGVKGLTPLIVWSWLLALAGYLFTRAFAAARLERLLEQRYVLSGDVFRDVDRLERQTPLQIVRSLADPHEKRSVWLPLAGLALIVPLTLHLFTALLFSQSPRTFDRFEEWITLGTYTTGPAQLVLLLCAFRFARRLRARSLREIHHGLYSDGWEAYGLTVAASALWAILYGFGKVIITAGRMHGHYEAIGVAIAAFMILTITTLMFVPAMFGVVRGRVAAERFALGVQA